MRDSFIRGLLRWSRAPCAHLTHGHRGADLKWLHAQTVGRNLAGVTTWNVTEIHSMQLLMMILTCPHMGCGITRVIMHDDVIKWKHFPRNWPFVRGIHQSPVNSPHKGQWRAALMFTLICVWINGCVNNREAGDLRRYYAHYGVTVMGNPQFMGNGRVMLYTGSF